MSNVFTEWANHCMSVSGIANIPVPLWSTQICELSIILQFSPRCHGWTVKAHPTGSKGPGLKHSLCAGLFKTRFSSELEVKVVSRRSSSPPQLHRHRYGGRGGGCYCMNQLVPVQTGSYSSGQFPTRPLTKGQPLAFISWHGPCRMTVAQLYFTIIFSFYIHKDTGWI